MTLARPMFPPRADSAHAFSGEPAVQQRKRQKAIQRSLNDDDQTEWAHGDRRDLEEQCEDEGAAA